jgi:hypothetical protein
MWISLIFFYHITQQIFGVIEQGFGFFDSAVSFNQCPCAKALDKIKFLTIFADIYYRHGQNMLKRKETDCYQHRTDTVLLDMIWPGELLFSG